MNRSEQQLLKIKAHLTKADIVQWRIKSNQFMGNDWADFLAKVAKEAAAACQLPQTTINCVEWVYATAWLIPTRILAICKIHRDHHAETGLTSKRHAENQ